MPSKDLYYFYGQISYGDDAESRQKEEIDLMQFLHRGAIIRNSERVLALVVYTGKDTKLIKNFGTYKFKRPRFEKLLNIIVAI